MKNTRSSFKIGILLLLFILFFSISFAQAPQKMSYQAVIRDNNNSLVASTTIGMQISILQGSSSGVAVYMETQTPTTNANGSVNIEIGTGTVITGTFANINWATGPYFIKTETDLLGGTAYSIIGTTELISVPYALFSANSTPGPQGPAGANGQDGIIQNGANAGNTPYWNGLTWITNSSNIFNNGGNIGINDTLPAAKLHIKGNSDNTQLILQANSTQSNLNPLLKLQDNNGIDLMWLHSDDTTNTFIGLRAGSLNNVISGGTGNTFTGAYAGLSNVSGFYNTANGFQTLYSNSTGSFNSTYGFQSLYSNTVGNYNTANGHQSLFSNTTGSYNLGNGLAALFSNTTGSTNIATGHQALYSNTTGNNNVANGFGALYSNTNGQQNCAIGDRALFYNTIGNFNTANGTNSLGANINGDYNTANGINSLYQNTTGMKNFAGGANALFSNSTGNHNTALGFGAGSDVTTGSNNTAIGYNAQVPNPINDNQVRIGDALVTYAGVQVAWTITSDIKWKSDIRETNLGLDFITKLKPVSYIRTNDKSKKREYGFIAQEVEELLNSQSANDNGIVSKDDNNMYGLRYNDFISPMVKAIQELNKKNELLQKRLESLEFELQQIKDKLK